MVERYFFEIAEPAPDLLEEELSPRVRALSGVLKGERDTDLKKEYGEYLNGNTGFD